MIKPPRMTAQATALARCPSQPEAMLVKSTQFSVPPAWAQQTVVLMACTVLVASGMLLRLALIPSPLLAAVVLAVLVAAPVIGCAASRLADWPDRGWAEQEHRHHQALPAQVRCSPALDALYDHLLDAPAGRWRSVHLASPPPPPAGRQPTVMVCHSGNHLLAVIHRNLLDEDPTVAVACLARALATMRGWRFQLCTATYLARPGGLLVAGWAVRWPWLLPALALWQAITTLTLWLTELSADRCTLAHHGRTEVLRCLLPPSSSQPRTTLARWRRWVLTAVTTATGCLPPPRRLRRALATISHHQGTIP
jgi:hypothetical protein